MGCRAVAGIMAVAMAVAVVGCAADGGPSGALPGRGSTVANDRPTGSTSTPTPTTIVGTTAPSIFLAEVGTLTRIRLQPDEGPCRVVPGRTDFADLPVEAAEPTSAPSEGGPTDHSDPFAGEAGIPIGLFPPWFGADGPWFQLGAFGAVHLDASSVSADAVLLVDEGCRVERVAGSDESVALFVCNEAGSSPSGCAVIVVGRDGAEVARWAVHLDPASTMGWADGDIVFDVALAGPEPQIGWRAVVIDPSSGEGTSLISDGRCGGGDSDDVVARTALVVAECGTGHGSETEHRLIDAHTGAVLQALPERVQYLSPGTTVQPLGSPAYGVDTLAEVAPPVPASVIDPILADPDVDHAVATPIGVWVQRQVEPPGVELSFVDLTGRTTARWRLPTVSFGRGIPEPTPSITPSYDATGAWVAVDGRIVRIDPIR